MILIMNPSHEIPINKTNHQASEGIRPLPPDFLPGEFDVICGRGKSARDHQGNQLFRVAVEFAIDRYSEASTKIEKSLVVSKIVESIREKSPDGGFVKKESGRWFEVGDHMAREKVGQSLRDLLHNKYRSSTKAKKIRRKQITVKMSDDVDELIMTNTAVARKIERLSQDIKRGASDQYIGDLFNQTNAAILDEIKKDERLQLAAACYKNTDADESVSSDSKPKSSSMSRNSKVPSSSSTALYDADGAPTHQHQNKRARARDHSSCSSDDDHNTKI